MQEGMKIEFIKFFLGVRRAYLGKVLCLFSGRITGNLFLKSEVLWGVKRSKMVGWDVIF